ncbi:MAG TPA: phosphoenolpyruvate synthase, partial [Nanoarchaeota archaeon]|nr:phosphoenolpyruvate synthase [Nanoarchaeota archaeon]
MQYVNFPEEVNEESLNKIGGKAFNLAKMIKAGFPVPECFFVNTYAYHRFLEVNDLKEKILERISKINFSDVNSIIEASKEIRSWIIQASMPEDVKNEIIEAYRKLAKGEIANIDVGMVSTYREDLFVAVRSSAVTEDIGKASAAGQQETFLNIRGALNVVECVKKCWASLFTPRAIYYRYQKNLPHDAGMGVVVQKMVNSEKSGVMFTINPSKPDETNVIVIEAVWGLGETIVQGEVTPDLYIVDKQTGEILKKEIGKKVWERIRDVTGRTVKRNVPSERQEAQVLTDEEIIAVAAYGKKIEEYYGRPQDIEFAIERGKIYIVQARPVTFLAEDVKKLERKSKTQGKILVRGLGASPGIATGKVKIIHDISELGKIEKGDILVTEMTSPDYVPAMEKSAAIITDHGGMTCHAAIVSRELGIPCIVGTGNATKVLKDGMIVTVDATHGIVYEGEVETVEKEEKEKVVVSESEIITATKVKVNLAFPETAKLEIAEKTDGVGLLRLEHMLTKHGMHPMEYIRQGKHEELIRILEEGIGKVAEVFYPKPVWVRSLDARTDEFRHMQGGEKEPEEDNPMLGWHGIRRSIVE